MMQRDILPAASGGEVLQPACTYRRSTLLSPLIDQDPQLLRILKFPALMLSPLPPLRNFRIQCYNNDDVEE